MRRTLSGLPALFAVAGLIAPAMIRATGQGEKPAPRTSAGKPKARQTKAWVVPNTPWGDPDLQGIWDNTDNTPLERPGGSRPVFTEDEAAAKEGSNPGTYNEFW